MYKPIKPQTEFEYWKSPRFQVYLPTDITALEVWKICKFVVMTLRTRPKKGKLARWIDKTHNVVN